MGHRKPPPKRSRRKPPPKRTRRKPPPKRKLKPPPRRARKPAPQPTPRLAEADTTKHIRRVTLNLIRHANCCPDQLRPALERLEARDWELDALDRRDVELIYAYVTDDLGDRAVAEFEADPTSIIDHRASDATCKLCGHQHIRWEFRLANIQGGSDAWTGSTCITKYGLNVKGAQTAEEALALLQGAIREGIRKAEREAWQDEYPDHADKLRAVREARDWAKLYRDGPRGVPYKLLGVTWKEPVKELLKKTKAIAKYYEKWGYLTDLRTGQVYGEHSVIDEWNRLRSARDRAKKVLDERRAFWDEILTTPDLTSYERSLCARWQTYGDLPADLPSFYADKWVEIKAKYDAHKSGPAPTATHTSPLGLIPEDDLPF